jgi:hypothetical protein
LLPTSNRKDGGYVDAFCRDFETALDSLRSSPLFRSMFIDTNPIPVSAVGSGHGRRTGQLPLDGSTTKTEQLREVLDPMIAGGLRGAWADGIDHRETSQRSSGWNWWAVDLKQDLLRAPVETGAALSSPNKRRF